MSVLDVRAIADGVTGGADVESGGRYTRVFQVEFDIINADVVAAITATDGTTSIPAYGDAYPSDSSSVVTGLSGDPHVDNPMIWIVRVNYTVPKVNPLAPDSPDPPSGGGGTGSVDPITSQKLTWRFYTKTETVLDDINGDAIVNSAGDPFDPPYTREVQYCELVVERTQSSFSPQWMLDYRNKRNSAAITIGGVVWLTKQLRIVDIQAVRPAGQTGGSWQVTLVIRYDPEEHDLVIRDAGLREKVAGIMVHILENGQRVVQPALLNGAGRKLTVGAAPVLLPSVEIYDTVDFTNLRLDY